MLRHITNLMHKIKINNVIQVKNLMLKNSNVTQNIVWVDLEMTGLQIETDRILEIGCLVTDKNLNIISEEAHFVIHQSNDVLDSMNDWCKVHHGRTGLTEASKNSIFTETQVEQEIMKFIEPYTKEKFTPLAGNSIYMDRLFLIKYMPTLNEYLSYRIIDVSSIKELCKRWNNTVYCKAPKKRLGHRSVEDIKESIAELSYYKKHFFNN